MTTLPTEGTHAEQTPMIDTPTEPALTVRQFYKAHTSAVLLAFYAPDKHYPDYIMVAMKAGEYADAMLAEDRLHAKQLSQPATTPVIP